MARLEPRSNSRRSTISLTLNIVYRLTEELKPDPANPRRHTKKQIRQIAQSIKTFGFNVPILVDRNGNIIAGHGRYFACLLLGITEVPTLCLDHLTPEQVRAFMIADNRLSEISTWDDRLLAQQLKDLSLHGLDFSVEVTGFEMGEIDLRIASLDEPPERGDRLNNETLRSAQRTENVLKRHGSLYCFAASCSSCQIVTAPGSPSSPASASGRRASTCSARSSAAASGSGGAAPLCPWRRNSTRCLRF